MFLTIVRGDAWDETFQILWNGDPMDLNTCSLIRFTIKNDPEDLDSDALLRLSTGVGGVTILTQSGDTLGMLTVAITAAQLAAMLLVAGRRAFWDIQVLLNDGRPKTPLMGEVLFPGDITRNYTGDVGTDT